MIKNYNKNLKKTKVVILCGGLGSRLAEETKIRPKPMVKIGKLPILSHIINFYSKFGYKDFILALGYKGNYIKKKLKFNRKKLNISFVDTGLKTLTGDRLFRLKKYLLKEDYFHLTYGDGLTNQNLDKLEKFHLSHKKVATLTAVRPPVRFGELELKGNLVKQFKEKTQTEKLWINGGYFIFTNKIFKFIKNNKTMLETKPLELLTKQKQLKAFKHKGFWQCMDTMREKKVLEKLIKQKKAPWL